MIDSEFKIRIKIISGYLLITILTIIAGWWVYDNVYNLAADDKSEYGKLYDKSAITSAVISHLYKVDYYGNRLTQSYSASAMKQYKEALVVLYANIDSLKSKIVSEHQVELLDELSILLKRKNRNTLELTKIRFNAQNDNYDNYDRSIDEALRQNSHDSLESVVVISTISNDTIKSPEPVKRTFFQRLGDAFSPKKSIPQNDQIITSFKTDTLRSKQAPSDSINIALQRAREEMSANRLKLHQTITSKLQELIATEQQISVQISLIISELYQEAAQNSIDEIDAKHSALQYTGRIVARIAVIAVVIIVFFLFFILRDVSRSARYKIDLEAARTRAEDLMNSRHRMLLNISHDIKAPLCSITGYLDLMQNSVDRDVAKWSESMKISAGYIMDLLTNLLEYARLESGKSVVSLSVFDIDNMIGDIAKIFVPMAKDKGIVLSVNLPETMVGSISSDAIRIRQIVMNLISNAVKFTDHGDVQVTYYLEGDNRLIVSVIDSGPGISESKLGTIFEEFTRIANTEVVEGSGLGLAVVSGAITLLGGKISVESNQGQGSKFTISIPVKRVSVKIESLPKKVAPQTILIVDDDPLQLRMMSEMIYRGSHYVHCASRLKDVNRIMNNHKIDLVLTDLQMGNFSGYKLLSELRARGFTTPIVAVSASDRANGAELSKAGFSDFLCKPFTLGELNNIIARNIPQSDVASLDELMEDDQEAIKEIMDLFMAATVENVEVLKKCVADNRLEDARRLCHKMLPMFVQLQFIEVANLLKEVDAGNFDSTKLELIITLSQDITNQYHTV